MKKCEKIESDRLVEEPNESYTSSTFRFLLTEHAIIDFLLLRLDPPFPLGRLFLGPPSHPVFVTVSLACNIEPTLNIKTCSRSVSFHDTSAVNTVQQFYLLYRGTDPTVQTGPRTYQASAQARSLGNTGLSSRYLRFLHLRIIVLRYSLIAFRIGFPIRDTTRNSFMSPNIWRILKTFESF